MKPSFGCGLAIATVLLASPLFFASAATVAAPADTSATPAVASAPAKWAPRKLRFTYLGFTAKYSCDGLQDQMKRILQQLGAGDDLVVKRSGCTRLDGPEPSPGVYATFSVLESAEKDDHGSGQSQNLAARWETVTLDSDTTNRSNSGDCELIEQVKKEVLPLFTTRNLSYSSSCFPHDVSLTGTRLSVEVLRPVKPASAAHAPA
jgi:hypothetical protein